MLEKYTKPPKISRGRGQNVLFVLFVFVFWNLAVGILIPVVNINISLPKRKSLLKQEAREKEVAGKVVFLQ